MYSAEAVSTDFVSTVKDFVAVEFDYLNHHNSIAAGELGTLAGQFASGTRTSPARGVGGRLASAAAGRRARPAFGVHRCC